MDYGKQTDAPGNIPNRHEMHVKHTHASIERLSPRRLLVASALNVGFAITELAGGLLSNSLALISDSVHNFADTSSLAIAFVANRIGLKQRTSKYTFGYHRLEILTALCNAVVLLVVYLFIFIEAFKRIHSHTHIDSRMMLTIAGLGIGVKLVAMLILRRPSRGSLNVRAAYLHLLADIFSSLTVICGGLAIQLWHLTWIDPLITFGAGTYIVLRTCPILLESLRILMEASPRGIDIQPIIEWVEQCDKITAVRETHLWQISEQDVYFAARLTFHNIHNLEQAQAQLEEIETGIKRHFGIQHAFLSIDTGTSKHKGTLKARLRPQDLNVEQDLCTSTTPFEHTSPPSPPIFT